MRIRDLIEHKVKTKHSGFDKSKLRTTISDHDDEEETETPVVNLVGDGTTPGVTAVGLQAAPMTPTFESLRRLTEVSWMTYVSVIAKQTGTKARDWEEADGPQIGPGTDYWYVHKTTNEIVQVTVNKGKALFKRSTEDGEPIDAWELT
jgi:hypothetical protein